MAGHALPSRTSPTQRGKFVSEELFCRTVPPPPNNVPPTKPASAGGTTRQRFEEHDKNPCAQGCHTIMDPLGFGMEGFDSSGHYRTTDNGQPIDGSGTLDGVAFSNLAELGAAVQKNPVTGPCMVSNIYENALGRTPVAIDNNTINQLAGQFSAAGNRLDQLLVDLVGSDGFRFVTPM